MSVPVYAISIRFATLRHGRPRAARSACRSATPGSICGSACICGHVGCCDSSKNKHATKHFHATTHPIVQSFEPGEDWLWCFVDQVAMEPGR